MKSVLAFLLICICAAGVSASIADDLEKAAALYYAFEENDTTILVENQGYWKTNGSATTNTQNMAYGSGKFGSAFDFNNQYIDTTIDAGRINDSKLSVAAWVYVDANADSVVIDAQSWSETRPGFNLAINPLYFYSNFGAQSSHSGVVGSDPSILGKWVFLVSTFEEGSQKIYVDGVLNGSHSVSPVHLSFSGKNIRIGRNTDLNTQQVDAKIDEVMIFDNYTLSQEEIDYLVENPLFLNSLRVVPSSVNFTSQGGQACGYYEDDYITCGPTSDTTPTFKFKTYTDMTCKVYNESLNYTSLESLSVADCATTEGTNHVCTYPEPLSIGTQLLTVSCKTEEQEMKVFDGASVLNISITEGFSDEYGQEAIEQGIQQSSIGLFASTSTDQQVYVRTVDDAHAVAEFSKVAMYKHQRWGFHFVKENETTIQPFYNLSPVFYFLELDRNFSSSEIIEAVKEFIEQTKE